MRKLSLLFLIVGIVIPGVLGNGWAPKSVLAKPAAAKTLAGEWEDQGPFSQMAAFRLDNPGGGPFGPPAYTSSVKRAAFRFNAVGFNWPAGTSAGDPFTIELRTSLDGTDWSSWTGVPSDDAGAPYLQERHFSELVTGLSANLLQYRLIFPATQPAPPFLPDEIKVVYLDSTQGPALQDLPGSASLRSETGGASIRVISRAEWGADESLRFKDGKDSWPPRYRAVEKAIIHHTETPNNDPDPMATIRGIYYYHTVIKDWGDIGYNFLIDSQGNVYEGRQGGDNVVAGHAISYNLGSLGVGLLGAYSEADVPAAAENALVQLLAWKLRNIDPHGESFFIDKRLLNIMGHRDALPTDCPGEYLYQRLPEIRDRVGEAVGFTPSQDLQVGVVTLSPAQVATGDNLEVRFVVKNTGTATVFSHGPAAGFVYNQGETFQGVGHSEVEGKFRLAVDSSGSGVSHPYRWGIGEALQPGESAEITGFIRLYAPGTYTFWGALFQEGMRVWEDNLAPTVITVVPKEPSPNPTNRTSPLDRFEAERTYFPETGHTLSYGFLRYWTEHGGLAQFGYPRTEEITEASPTDGQPRTVQYFERARFEYHPEFKETPFEVQLGMLGSELTFGRDFTWVEEFESGWEQMFFKETRHSLSGAFLDYWRETGGLARHGLPLSEEVLEFNPSDGQIYTVQYFERSRFEYHPELEGTGQAVQLGLLGDESLRRRGWLR